ncbi:hypothetical protein PPACK8108_LOCUS13897 [Phakopsora pachyrhizi]|uniref:Lipoyl-binding domain-containing protein n=1 Tax=Phakopsora pachyrhizi TaxID=170000 RepID=A0AAV0B7B3_PHAPC|nr:hypothetical protein PPACK8108_LOCUS13897 [Phakopsora pachyrhizi]
MSRAGASALLMSDLKEAKSHLIFADRRLVFIMERGFGEVIFLNLKRKVLTWEKHYEQLFPPLPEVFSQEDLISTARIPEIDWHKSISLGYIARRKYSYKAALHDNSASTSSTSSFEIQLLNSEQPENIIKAQAGLIDYKTTLISSSYHVFLSYNGKRTNFTLQNLFKLDSATELEIPSSSWLKDPAEGSDNSNLDGKIIRALMPSKVIKILAKEGDSVKSGDGLGKVEEIKVQEVFNKHKGIITKLYDFYKRSLETEPGEEEPQVPSATELCSVLPNIQADDPSITTTQAEEPTITTTQAAEIEASSDSVSNTIKHQLSHQSIQNTLPPTKRHSKRLQALSKTQAGRVLQGFQSSYSLRNPTGQGLIPQGGIPISAEDCEQIQENEMSTDNVPVTQEKTDEQPLFRDEEQLESETHVPTEEAPITSGSQQTLPAGLRFQKKTPHQKEAPQLNINHFLPRQSTSKSVSQTRSELIREGSTSSSECALLL